MPGRPRRANCSGPGLARKRQGRGFRYVDAAGNAVTDRDVRARIDALVIPPAWQDVWICAIAIGHIQATGAVLAAVALGVSRHAGRSESARKPAVARAVKEVSEYLGNTPAVCRSSYIDPRIVSLYEQGRTIEPAVDELGAEVEYGTLATQGPTEQAVLELLRGPSKAAAAQEPATATWKRLRKAG